MRSYAKNIRRLYFKLAITLSMKLSLRQLQTPTNVIVSCSLSDQMKQIQQVNLIVGYQIIVARAARVASPISAKFSPKWIYYTTKHYYLFLST